MAESQKIDRGIDKDAPKGIPFFSTRTGETNYAKSGAQIQAYINSSDMGINASRGQDFGWKLDAEWVKKIRAFKEDEDKMDTLSAKLRLEEGASPTDIQILHYIYGRQVRAYLQRSKANSNPYEQDYYMKLQGNAEEKVTETVEEPKKPATKK